MIQAGFKTDKGQVRAHNEDAYFVLPEYKAYIIADGVGGHNSGELASRTAVSGIAEYIKANPFEEIQDEERLRRYFLNCFRQVNRKICAMAAERPEHKGMATTAVTLCFRGDKAYLINVGDSRAYVIRHEMMSQITQDHTYVNELLKTGTITKEEAKVHPQKNMITRALGGNQQIEPDFYLIEIEKNDIFILCTDGLYNEVSEKQICQMAVAAGSMSSLSNDLIKLANENGGHDNITAVCLKIGTGGVSYE